MEKKEDFRNIEKPFTIRLSFANLFDHLEQMISKGTETQSALAKNIIARISDRKALTDGFMIDEGYNEHIKDIQNLVGFLFPAPLMDNEIKIAIPPLSSKLLYSTRRFDKIFGGTDELMAKEFDSVDEEMIYIHMCTFILASHYGIALRTDVPPVYEVEDKKGFTTYYKSTYNADFMTIRPFGDPPDISNELVKKLKDNYEDIDMWKELFPPDSWEIGGFGLKNFTHVSNEESLSRIKNILIGNKAKTDRHSFRIKMNSYISTLLGVPDVKTSFVMYDESRGEFLNSHEVEESFALHSVQHCKEGSLLCDYGLKQIFKNKEDFIVSNVDRLPKEAFEIELYRTLRDQNVKSYIMTPLYYDEELLGALEFASSTNGSFDRTHRYKIDQMKSLCINAIKQFKDDWENELTSIIQKEFTSIHPSVAWKFNEEAEKAYLAKMASLEYNIDNIAFNELTALYGQMDISGSSKARNDAIASDLKAQMTLVRSILDQMGAIVTMPLLDSIKYQVAIICEKLSSDLAAGMEQEVIEFLRLTINPLLQEMRARDVKLESAISAYFDRIGEDMEIIYDKRRDYDESVKMINMHLSGRMDQEQAKAQLIYPHYFERYKTDGVEHNMFIGQEIAPNLPYNKLYLENLRLWQLQTMCELEIEHHRRKDELAVPLVVASLIMIYSNPLAIRYRMDEKQFDVDGAYNARYEIIKKRIDKAHIKGTDERITEPGKIVMIYTHPGDLEEYLNYVHYLAYQGFLKGEPESFDIEDLEGVVGLKGLRVSVNFDYKEKDDKVSGSKSKSKSKKAVS